MNDMYRDGLKLTVKSLRAICNLQFIDIFASYDGGEKLQQFTWTSPEADSYEGLAELLLSSAEEIGKALGTRANSELKNFYRLRLPLEYPTLWSPPIRLVIAPETWNRAWQARLDVIGEKKECTL